MCRLAGAVARLEAAMAFGLHRASLTKGRGKASLIDSGVAGERLTRSNPVYSKQVQRNSRAKVSIACDQDDCSKPSCGRRLFPPRDY